MVGFFKFLLSKRYGARGWKFSAAFRTPFTPRWNAERNLGHNGTREYVLCRPGQFPSAFTKIQRRNSSSSLDEDAEIRRQLEGLAKEFPRFFRRIDGVIEFVVDSEDESKEAREAEARLMALMDILEDEESPENLKESDDDSDEAEDETEAIFEEYTRLATAEAKERGDFEEDMSKLFSEGEREKILGDAFAEFEAYHSSIKHEQDFQSVAAMKEEMEQVVTAEDVDEVPATRRGT